MSELVVETCDTTSSEKPIFWTETAGSRGGLIGSILWIMPTQENNTTSWALVGRPRYSPLIPKDIEADKLRYSFLVDESNGEIAVDLDNFRRTVANLLGELREVRAVFIVPHDGYFQVETYLRSRDRDVRRNLFSKQLDIHDRFPDISIDFKVSFSSKLPTFRDLPENAIRCLAR